jgi:hypothetical protein
VRFWVAIPIMDELSRTAGPSLQAVAVFDADARLVTADSCTRTRYSATSAPACRRTARSRVEALLADPAARSALRSIPTAAPERQTVTGTARPTG